LTQPQSATQPPSTDALVAYGWTEDIKQRYESRLSPDVQPARIVRVDRGEFVVATSRGVERCFPSSHGSEDRATPELPATGDWVTIRDRPGLGWRLETILPRRSAVSRLNAAANGEQVLAANVDIMFALHGVDRPHRVGRLERLCLVSWDANTTPVIVLTKTDLLGTDGAVIDLTDSIREIRRVIRRVEIHPVSSATGDGVAQLYQYLGPGQTVGVMGESGAGKSTLINHLAGVDRQATGRTRRNDHKGRHTTTSRELVPLDLGGTIIDTPGLRSVSLLGSEEGLSRSYDDVEALFASCRFRNCGHSSEPDCGVSAALAAGTLEPLRWAAYQKLLKEIAHEAKRSAVRARRAQARDNPKAQRSRDQAQEW
jgi:ribosome biogenesis GTPase